MAAMIRLFIYQNLPAHNSWGWRNTMSMPMAVSTMNAGIRTRRPCW